jgi:hypothetical protein
MIITLTDMRFRQIRFNCNLATHHGGIPVLLEITKHYFQRLVKGKNTLSNEIQHLMHQMTHTHGRVCVNVSTPLPCKIKIIANKHKIRKKIMQPAHNIEHFVVCASFDASNVEFHLKVYFSP